MRTSAFTLLASAAVASAVAIPTTGTVVIEKNLGGVTGQKQNTTITVPLDFEQPVYNEEAFAAVSTLYLIEPSLAFCSTFDVDGNGIGGADFSVGLPAHLSTNTVKIGSLRCYYGE
ncbi:hypothetical protein GGR57DRAFT_486124 [Xylariaceae sp. FL1272]|nr:hypothetical protein GGR57DRAFT_486124 [Xylariaceae sp. FL1272]